MALRVNKISIREIFNFLFEGNSTFNLLCCTLWGLTLLGYLAGGVMHFCSYIPDSRYITFPIIIIVLFFAIPQIIKRLSIKDIIFYLLCVCVYLSQYSLFQTNLEPLDEFALRCCFTVFPFFFFGKMVDIPKMFNAFYYISLATIAMFAFYFIIYGQGSSQVSSEDYNMDAAYNLLPHVLMVLWKTIREFSPLRAFIGLLSTMLLIMFGTRGPLLSLVLPIVIYVFFAYHGKHAKLFRWIMIIVAIVLILVLIPLAMYLTDIFDSLDVNSRILEKILDNEIEDDSGRGALIVELNGHLLTEDKIFGYGLFGSYQYIGGYPHNIFYELIFSFGFLVGSILIILMLRHFIMGYCNAADDITKEFILLFTLMELTHLCLSYTFLTEQMFFLLLGVCAQRYRKSNKITIVSNNLTTE